MGVNQEVFLIKVEIHMMPDFKRTSPALTTKNITKNGRGVSTNFIPLASVGDSHFFTGQSCVNILLYSFTAWLDKQMVFLVVYIYIFNGNKIPQLIFIEIRHQRPQYYRTFSGGIGFCQNGKPLYAAPVPARHLA
jgi:hypothetical protein